jgi:hypothetical protein
MSLNRKQYEFLFRYATRVYNDAALNSPAEIESVIVMYMIEDVIGQQSDFMPSARENYPRESLRAGDLLPTITTRSPKK